MSSSREDFNESAVKSGLVFHNEDSDTSLGILDGLYHNGYVNAVGQMSWSQNSNFAVNDSDVGPYSAFTDFQDSIIWSDII